VTLAFEYGRPRRGAAAASLPFSARPCQAGGVLAIGASALASGSRRLSARHIRHYTWLDSGQFDRYCHVFAAGTCKHDHSQHSCSRPDYAPFLMSLFASLPTWWRVSRRILRTTTSRLFSHQLSDFQKAESLF
jgi:hypothetical protein